MNVPAVGLTVHVYNSAMHALTPQHWKRKHVSSAGLLHLCVLEE